MTSRELIRWSRLHDDRARRSPALALPLVLGGGLAAWVAWRGRAGEVAASHAWLAGAIVGYAVAFLRAPFLIYWRADAPLLAQLPIAGRALFDSALVRCVAGAAATTLAALIGAVPLALGDGGAGLALRHAAVAGALAAAAGLLLPAVTVGAAAIVVRGGAQVLAAASAIGGAPTRPSPAARPAGPPSSPSAILGALPGLVAAGVLVAVLLVAPWLTGGAEPAPVVLGALAAASLGAILVARAGADIMAQVLRDVSALDRQQLATLDLRPPTAIERAIARLIGDAALVYAKDARLMRRRYPMAFALGGAAMITLVIVGLAQPADPTGWLTVVIGGAAAYGLVLARRLDRPPIELGRLASALPLTSRALARAKLAWLAGWWLSFVAAPAVFASLRADDPALGLGLTAAATLAIVIAGALARR